MSDDAEILFANDAFYTAFDSGDIDAMDNIWARDHPVSCIHPGWQPLVGRDHVMDSWRQIMSGGNAPDISCAEARAFLLGDGAYVICDEHLSGSIMVATNIFVREDDHWKMMHHQAGASHAPKKPVPAAPTMQ